MDNFSLDQKHSGLRTLLIWRGLLQARTSNSLQADVDLLAIIIIIIIILISSLYYYSQDKIHLTPKNKIKKSEDSYLHKVRRVLKAKVKF